MPYLWRGGPVEQALRDYVEQYNADHAPANLELKAVIDTAVLMYLRAHGPQIVIQRSARETGAPIFGAGRTPAVAQRRGATYLGGGVRIGRWDDIMAEYVLWPASVELVDAVHADGGGVDWVVVDGLAVPA